jgi:RNA polymerase sigma factor (TIGR02999 family)
MPAPKPPPVTDLLHRWREGDREALDRLLPLVYAELRRAARREVAREGGAHTLQPTALVHEAYLRLSGGPVRVDWADRAHFVAVAARVMREVLIDAARARRRKKRGGDAVRVTFDEAIAGSRGPDLDLLELDRALTELAGRSERKARLVELHFFGGLGQAELAEALRISIATVQRELRFAKAWLRRELSRAEPAP